MKLKPSGYRTAAESRQSGYLEARFREIKKRQLAERLKQEAEERETNEKVLMLNALNRRLAA